MKFYQNIGHFASLIALTGIISLTCFGVTASARGASRAAMAKTTETTQVTTQAVTETTTEATTYAVTETTTEAYTNADGTPMSPEEITVYNTVKNTPKTPGAQVTAPIPSDTFEETDNIRKSKRSFSFPTGDIYNIIRYEYKDSATQPVNESIEIPGSSIEIRYLDENDEWTCTTNTEKANAAVRTMFIDTDKCSLIVSVPSVYKDSYLNNTLEIVPELESGIKLEKSDAGYTISYGFPLAEDIVGEIWYLYSERRLADWNNINHFNVLKQDFNKTHRFSFDGYYYPTPYNYEPTGENVLYRQPSDYVGALFVRMGDIPAAFDLGYVMTYTCMKNQNTQGYWATGPKSEWLFTDFKIGANFYDTRFNTDFASSLLDAYQRYGNTDFLASAVRYAEYFKKHAANHSYATKNGGLLVEDYGSFEGNHNRTHVSLNHHIAEANFLYRLYDITREESYLELADKMLVGVSDTQDQWVLADNNLNYALYYTGTYNVMKDYPYLTYNDLFTTKELLYGYFNRTDPTIEYLMACKLEWMKENNVTGYYTQ